MLRSGIERRGEAVRSMDRSGMLRNGRFLRSATLMPALMRVSSASEVPRGQLPASASLRREHHLVAGSPAPGRSMSVSLVPPKVKAASGRSRRIEPLQSTSLTLRSASPGGSRATTWVQATLMSGTPAREVLASIACQVVLPRKGIDDRGRATDRCSRPSDTRVRLPRGEPARSERSTGAAWTPELPATPVTEPGVGLAGCPGVLVVRLTMPAVAHCGLRLPQSSSVATG